MDKYLVEYQSIIKNALHCYNENEYKERHHIIPKSIFNDEDSKILFPNIKDVDDPQNLVTLSAQDHYRVHFLLVEIFRNVNVNCYIRMLYAFNFMDNRLNGSPKEYKKVREEFSRFMSNLLKGKPSRAKGCAWSEESKKRKSMSHPLKGKIYEEYYDYKKAKELKDKRKMSATGVVFSEERRDKLRYKKTKEHREKISKAKMGCVSSHFSDDTKHHSVDQTKYWFVNKHTGEIIYARKIDMKKTFGCGGIYNVVSGKWLHTKGWMLLKQEKKNG